MNGDREKERPAIFENLYGRPFGQACETFVFSVGVSELSDGGTTIPGYIPWNLQLNYIIGSSETGAIQCLNLSKIMFY